MPYIQFVKDRRGYEQTSVMHAYRRRGRSKAAILYLYRTPPNVRVGRPALDPEAIRALEAGHPELQFDWDRMLKDRPAEPPRTHRQAPSARGEGWRGPSRPREPHAEARRADLAPAEEPDASTAPDLADETDRALEPVSVLAAAAPDIVSPDDLGAAGSMLTLHDRSQDEAGAPAADARLGRESLARYRARYAELLARIAERVTDPALREVLRRDAERLDPDTWVTAEEAERGVSGFESALDAIRAQLGRRRRARRGGARRRVRRSAPADASGAPTPAPNEEPERTADDSPGGASDSDSE